MLDYASKSYGRNDEVAAIFRMFEANHHVSMPGPRRLGKTFILDRMVEAAADAGWCAVKVEVAGCCDTSSFFRELCSKIGSKRSGGAATISRLKQRLGQALEPRLHHAGPWYQPFLSLDHETYFERLIKALNDDELHRWALLIDELPIFLKALHDRGPDGLKAARDFMNLSSRLRSEYPRVRWMVTGSVGLEPLARAGNYMGVLAKFKTFELQPLSASQAKDLVQDLARAGLLMHRQAITDVEAQGLVDAVGWLAPYYLEALAQKLSGESSNDALKAQQLVEDAVGRLLQPSELATFGVWEEHLRKHYHSAERAIAIAALASLASSSQGSNISALLAVVGDPALTQSGLHAVLTRLHVEGFITVVDWDSPEPMAAFRNPLLRRWWQRYQPQATA